MTRKHLCIFTSLVIFLLAMICITIWIPQAHNDLILWKIRLPRLAMALIIGAGLATSGAVIQTILHNPLAEPYTLGISGGAAVGASMAVLLSLNLATTNLLGFACAMITIVILLILQRKTTTSTLILAGVMLSFFFSSAVMLLFALASPLQLKQIMMWLMGDLSVVHSHFLTFTSIIIVTIILACCLLHRRLDILSLGDERAEQLGISVKANKAFLMTAIGILSALAVVNCGVIGFVGLMIPHLVRYLGGTHHAYVLPASALCGASFLALCDFIARTLIAPMDIPIGVLTGSIGGLFFIIALLSSQHKRWLA